MASVAAPSDSETTKIGSLLYWNTLRCLKRDTGLSFEIFQEGYIGQAVLGSKFQMRDPCHV